jgi:hypothetical protein
MWTPTSIISRGSDLVENPRRRNTRVEFIVILKAQILVNVSELSRYTFSILLTLFQGENIIVKFCIVNLFWEIWYNLLTVGWAELLLLLDFLTLAKTSAQKLIPCLYFQTYYLQT